MSISVEEVTTPGACAGTDPLRSQLQTTVVTLLLLLRRSRLLIRLLNFLIAIEPGVLWHPLDIAIAVDNWTVTVEESSITSPGACSELHDRSYMDC